MLQLKALFLTLLIELPVAYIWASWLGVLKHNKVYRLLGIVAACSLLTHPFVWVLTAADLPVPQLYRIYGIELAVIGVEGLMLKHFLHHVSWLKAMLISLVMNTASWQIGLWLWNRF